MRIAFTIRRTYIHTLLALDCVRATRVFNDWAERWVEETDIANMALLAAKCSKWMASRRLTTINMPLSGIYCCFACNYLLPLKVAVATAMVKARTIVVVRPISFIIGRYFTIWIAINPTSNQVGGVIGKSR